MKKYCLFLIILCTVLISCDIDPPGPAELSDEEHAVISAVLDSIRMMGNPVGTLDVYDLTSTSTCCQTLNNVFERDSIGSDSLLSIYDMANGTRYALNRDKLPDYVMLKDTEESDFYSGFLAFTRPGISDDELTAVVEYSSVSAPLCGVGMAVVLEKQEGEWVIIWLDMMWIS